MAPERPRVLFLGPDVPGGMSASIRALMESPLGENYQLEFVATHRGTYGIPRRIAIFAAALARMTWWSLRGRGRLVHVHGTKRGSMFRKAVCVLVAKALRRQVVLHLHSGPGDIAIFKASLGRGGIWFLRLGIGRADAVVAVSEASAAAIGDAFGVPAIMVIPNLIAPVAAGADAAGEDGRPIAVYLGGFENSVKGGAVLLEALATAEFGGGRVLLAGPGEPSDRDRHLIEARDAVEWRGWLDPAAKADVLRAAQIFVLPSTSEGLPMALLEAMAYGLAIVATPVGGVPETVEAGADAMLVPAGDPTALRDALVDLLDDRELRRRLGAAARERSRRFSPERVAAEFADLYRELLGNAA
jgi:glycosyltransferase involved in cell wall biosynthesis